MSIKEIRAICNNYGEAVFRMALAHLFEVGADRLRNVNVEEAVKEILASKTKNAIITGEMQVQILRCSCELANKEIMDILAFVKTDIGFSGVTVHPGIFIDFCSKRSGRLYTTYVAPSGTDEDQIEEVVDSIRQNLMNTCRDGNVSSVIRHEFNKKGIRLGVIQPDMTFEI